MAYAVPHAVAAGLRRLLPANPGLRWAAATIGGARYRESFSLLTFLVDCFVLLNQGPLLLTRSLITGNR